MLRVVAGELGGRRLKAPAGTATRPTAEKVRAAIFNILGAPADDLRVLDLYAGAGAMGLEALSRGAAHATFVDKDGGAARVVGDNVAALGVGERARVLRLDAAAAVRKLAGERFDWIFVDPPYGSDEVARVLPLLGELLADGGVVVVEHDRRREPEAQAGVLFRADVRKYGDTRVAFFHRHDVSEAKPT
jgi:16S rRNA (guanine966-N2)-methyltransferase